MPGRRLVGGFAVLVILVKACLAGAQGDFVIRAKDAKAKGRVQTAIRVLEDGIAREPGNVSGHQTLAWLYAGRGQQDQRPRRSER